jgi:hypothetical protein
MAMEKISITLRESIASEARRVAGKRGLSGLVNTALEQYLQALRLQKLEEEMTAEFGPISEEAQRRAEAIKWPV